MRPLGVGVGHELGEHGVLVRSVFPIEPELGVVRQQTAPQRD